MKYRNLHTRVRNRFFTRNGYSDLVVMSSELYERFARVNCVDKSIEEAEREVKEGVKPISAKQARKKLDAKYYGKD